MRIAASTAITPLGNTAPAYWEGLRTGTSGAATITRFDPAKFKTRFACEVKNFDPTQFMDRKEARRMDRFTQFAMVSCDEAVVDSGMNLEKVNKDRIGVIWGSGIGGLKTFLDEVSAFARGDGTY